MIQDPGGLGAAAPPAAPVLNPGDPVPWFVARSSVNPQFNFDTLAGRYVVLCFLGSGVHPAANALLAGFARHGDLLDGCRACLFAVSMDPAHADGSRSLPEHSWLR